jgi:hypothetical protein
VGDEFLKDLALGKSEIEPGLLTEDVRDMFMPEELFYFKKRHRS